MEERTSKNKYEELSKAKISESRNAVISKHIGGGFTIAQQLDFNENGTMVKVFMKGALHVENVDGLASLKNAIDEAISKAEDDEELFTH